MEPFFQSLNTVFFSLLAELGQRCYIGKVCMDRNSPDYYIEETEQSIKDTERYDQSLLLPG